MKPRVVITFSLLLVRLTSGALLGGWPTAGGRDRTYLRTKYLHNPKENNVIQNVWCELRRGEVRV